MTLRKLTLSISILATSLMLAAPAQAETWFCTTKLTSKKKGHLPYEAAGVMRMVFIRDGDQFITKFGDEALSSQILTENRHVINIAHVRPGSGTYANLNKDSKTVSVGRLLENFGILGMGTCDIH